MSVPKLNLLSISQLSYQSGHRVMAVIKDDIKDYLLLHLSSQSWTRCSLTLFRNEAELIAGLQMTPDTDLPTLIILDTKSSSLESFATLSFLKNSHRLEAVPTVLLIDQYAQEVMDRTSHALSSALADYELFSGKPVWKFHRYGLKPSVALPTA